MASNALQHAHSEDEARRTAEDPHVVRSPRSKAEAIAAIGEALSFPSWFGQNLDALFDCLIDLSWLGNGEHVLVWSGTTVLAEADPDAFTAVRDTLADAVAESASLRIVLVD